MIGTKQFETNIPERPLTGNQLAEKLQVTPATVRLWRTEGLPHTQLSERLFRYNLPEVVGWLSDRASKKAKRGKG